MYIGNDLQIAHPSYKIIDDISSGFNGSTTSFALQVSGETPVPFPISTQQVMISVNGVVQEPDPTGSAGFKLLGSNIVFSSAPANGHAFFGVINAGADYVTAGSEFPDGSATAPSFTFQDDQDTGWYRNASGDVGYSSNGTAILNFDGNGLTIAAGKGLTVDTSTLKVDASSNRVGIGTASPSNNLHIASSLPTIRFEDTDVASGAAYSEINASSNAGFQVYCDPTNVRSSSDFRIYIDGTNDAARKLTVDSSGMVGIGTTSPSSYNNLADNLVIADSSNSGITIASGTSSQGSLFFADGTSGSALVEGFIAYEHTDNILKLGTSNAERMRIDSSGRLLVGHTSDIGFGFRQQLVGTDGNTSSSSQMRFTASASGSTFVLAKSRNGTPGSKTIVQSGDNLGEIQFRGDDGVDYMSIASSIKAEVDGTPGAGDMPGRLVFSTTADGAESATERMRITSGGDCLIGATSGTHRLTVQESSDTEIARFLGANSADLKFRNSTSNDFLIYTGTSDRLLFGTNGQNVALTLDTSQNATFAGTVSDSKGNLRSIPKNAKTSAYTAVAADAGKAITISSGGVTLNNNVFSEGDALTIINDGTSDQTITQGSGLTIFYAADATSGNRTLAGRGMCSLYFLNGSYAYISGAGLS